MSVCPLCGVSCDPRLLAKSTQLRPPVARLVATEHPSWHPSHGLCPACARHYVEKLVSVRQATSLHTTHEPHTTFPYYHADEETVLSQSERLPDYASFPGTGVTVAFLDSGYYPHPDLLTQSTWGDHAPPWERLTAHDLQMLLRERELRLVDYIDLTDGGERRGLDQPSLWDGAGDSWHGQMTTTLVAGNGLMSSGYYRGYAPRAALLPIKIGRGGGRIPEEDILRGLQWLLHDNNWARYHVRVLNISVGGDFVQSWRNNPVALAAEALAERGVLIAAAAGNSGREELRAPASAPSVLTVGGIDDGNQPWRGVEQVQHCALYPHNYGTVISKNGQQQLRKPELLALARWLAAPILPVSPIFREVATIAELRSLLLGYDPLRNDHVRGHEGSRGQGVNQYQPPHWMPEVWQGLRRRMNAHKWIHPYYQHVDGTSVSVAQVSAVAAQMIQANSQLTPPQIRELLLKSAVPLPAWPPYLTGAGLLQPRAAVAMALRTAGGPLVGQPLSGTILSADILAQLRLPKWYEQGTVPIVTGKQQESTTLHAVYLGLYAPHAQAVSVVGSFNNWQPGMFHMERIAAGWWHCAVIVMAGVHTYRFWVEEPTLSTGRWLPDFENSRTVESGYRDHHSVITV
ncbi:MAG: S8 family serine peptidase [Caldilineaceae bacterium]